MFFLWFITIIIIMEESESVLVVLLLESIASPLSLPWVCLLHNVLYFFPENVNVGDCTICAHGSWLVSRTLMEQDLGQLMARGPVRCPEKNYILWEPEPRGLHVSSVGGCLARKTRDLLSNYLHVVSLRHGSVRLFCSNLTALVRVQSFMDKSSSW